MLGIEDEKQKSYKTFRNEKVLLLQGCIFLVVSTESYYDARIH
jgi:hypothetical protein